MEFLSQEHKEKILRLESLWGNLINIAEMAEEYGIKDIFQDNGAKTLQQLTLLNFEVLPGREGNDAISNSGTEWEMKSINLDTSASGFSTNHHTNNVIIEKYRKIPWTFAIYRGIALEEIFVMTPEMLDPIFKHWEEKLIRDKMTHLNNPKIPVKFVRENGIKVYPINIENPIDPDEIMKSSVKSESCLRDINK